ncbi:MAG TPA: hypothetical protein VMD28_00145 [Acidimicrobiales bacterium]|nr:hypothetical protein [Acidimicrobiales bacterium]
MGEDDRWVDLEEASRILEAAPDQVQAMIDEGLLTVSGDHHEPRFLRAEVVALRGLGG